MKMSSQSWKRRDLRLQVEANLEGVKPKGRFCYSTDAHYVTKVAEFALFSSRTINVQAQLLNIHRATILRIRGKLRRFGILPPRPCLG